MSCLPVFPPAKKMKPLMNHKSIRSPISQTEQPDIQKTKRSKLRNDIIFVGILLLIVSIIGVYLFFFQKSGDLVKITIDGTLYGVYPLEKDDEIEIRTGADHEHLNLLMIENGRAYVKTANCPDGICVAHRPIFRDHESIACLPHRVVITVYSHRDAADIEL